VEIAGRAPGKNWASRWLTTHEKELGAGFLQALDAAHKKADSTLYYQQYFDLIKAKIKQYEVEPENMYNMDEKGFLIGYLKKMRRIYVSRCGNDGVGNH
jgi:hypothetical protein